MKLVTMVILVVIGMGFVIAGKPRRTTGEYGDRGPLGYPVGYTTDMLPGAGLVLFYWFEKKGL